MCVVYITWDAVKVVLSPVVSCLFFSLHSLLFISLASFSPLALDAYVYTERGKFRRSALYLRRASTSNGFDALGRNAYLSRAECVCHAGMCGAIPHARVRVRRAHACTSRYRAQGRRGRIHMHAHTHAGRTGVNYAPREMSNCSPYHKIYNSARCGKHYVLSPVPFLSPTL